MKAILKENKWISGFIVAFIALFNLFVEKLIPFFTEYLGENMEGFIIVLKILISIILGWITYSIVNLNLAHQLSEKFYEKLQPLFNEKTGDLIQLNGGNKDLEKENEKILEESTTINTNLKILQREYPKLERDLEKSKMEIDITKFVLHERLITISMVGVVKGTKEFLLNRFSKMENEEIESIKSKMKDVFNHKPGIEIENAINNFFDQTLIS